MDMLSIAGRSFLVTQERKQYTDLRKKFQGMAYDAKKSFLEEYKSNFKDMDALHSDCKSVAQQYLINAIEVAMQEMIKYDIKDVSDSLFTLKYVAPLITWDEDFAIIDDKYLQIGLKESDLDAYRENRKNDRARMIGGGFGVEGAAKGVLIAEATNLALGWVYEVIDTLETAFSSHTAQKKKAELYNDLSTKGYLSNSIYNLVFKVHKALTNLINSRHQNRPLCDVSDEDAEKSIGLFENVSKGRITGDKSDACLIDALVLNPYEPSLYFLWLDRNGDANGGLEDVASYFGVDAISEYKRQMIYAFLEKLKSTDTVDAKGCLTQIEHYACSLGIENVSALIPNIVSLAEKIDFDHRTVNGETYETNEEAIRAREAAKRKKEVLIKKRDEYINGSSANGWVVTSLDETSFIITYKKLDLGVFVILTLFLSILLALFMGWLGLLVAMAVSYYLATWAGTTTLVGSMDYINGIIRITNKGETHKTIEVDIG